ncbi:hypothetical protein AVEN_91755-1 [Araneus ventricosus]|uniref:Uncharacterized protein n=1 Tax=Araneus ventricosus TaxID=182803 RepID=A0A4Y2HV50_ARAVE|nr:hypothetical protein AVEN_91755-1 [Araneus ventricosus]
MASSSCIAIPILLSKLKNCCESSSGKSEVNPLQLRFGAQSGFQTLIWNTVLFRDSCENSCRALAQGTGHNFCQAWLNKLALRSNKCLNTRIFDDYVEK